MKKNTIYISTITFITIAAGIALSFECGNNLIKYLAASNNGGNLSLHLQNQKISQESSSYVEELSSTIRTTYGNNINVKASNVINYTEGWQTILPGGYFYNPIDATSHHNKITGIYSIGYNSLNSNSLSLYYGYSLDNSHINYSHKVTIDSGETFSFDVDKPNYFYIKNENNSNVNIEDLTIKYTCSDTGYSKQNLNVLMIGNSFSDDTIFYANRIASSYGVTLNIYDAYIASCTIDTHYSNLNSGAESYSMRSINNGSWVYNNNMSLTSIINSHSWDVITFQQASSVVGRGSSYSNLSSLVSGVRSLVGSSTKFYWYQTWAYDKDYHDYYDYFSYFGNDQNVMFEAINDCYESNVDSLNVFDKTIFAGTAVQNLRTSYLNETFTRDGKHMSSVHGRYLLGLNMVSNLFDFDLDMSPCSYLPNEINASFKNVAYEAIRNAYNSPLEATNSIYTTMDLGSYDLSQYTEIDAELVGCSYWNSTDSSNYNKRVSNASGSSNIYTSTKRFTSSTLPVGSLVVLGESFGMRPEAWISDAQQSSRPSETYQNVLEITSSFWSGYTYRAFNIFKAGKTELKGQYDQIFDSFHIYVPNASLGNIKPKDYNVYYDSDEMIFTSASLKFASFERMHLDPITGFYKCDSYYELTNSYVDDTAKKFMCSRPFYSANGDLPENTVIIVDSGYQWRSDCWTDHGTYSPRPNNVSSTLTRLTSSFWSGFRRRTFNVSSTSNGYVNQNYISFFNHMRIYIPISDDIDLPTEDKVTMTALGYATLTSAAASIYGKSQIPVLITLHGDDTSKVSVEVDGTNANATSYSFNKSTGALTINTSNSNYGTITGTVNRDSGTITKVKITGSFSSYLGDNGQVTCSESWFDRCNYSTNSASQAVWQRWYMSGSWQANSGNGEWTTANNIYLLDNDYSMGLRIANSSYVKTRFTLKNDFNGGSGFTPKGISIWLYNPNGDIYKTFKIFLYRAASTTSSGHAVPSSTYTQAYESTTILSTSGWKNIKFGLNLGTIYNMSLYFETSSSSTTYVYLGHVSFY